MHSAAAPAVTLLCLPYSGASATVYARWRRGLPDWIAVRPIELPGRGERSDEPLWTDPHGLAAFLAAEIAPGLAAPYALFGHSLGALLAFELAHALMARGAPAPLLLFASGTEAPSVRDDSASCAPRSDAALKQELRALNGTPEEVLADAEIMRLTLPVLRADFLMCGAYAYRPRPPLPCRVHALGGRDDRAGGAALEAWGREGTDAALDLFDGGHFFIHDQRAALLRVIRDSLERALGAPALHGMAAS
jgi:surfactin synthase thioesterase subunit